MGPRVTWAIINFTHIAPNLTAESRMTEVNETDRDLSYHSKPHGQKQAQKVERDPPKSTPETSLIKVCWAGCLGGSGSWASDSSFLAQIIIPGSWDGAPHQAPHWVWSLLGILSPSPSAPLLCLCTLALSLKLKKKKKICRATILIMQKKKS